MQHLARTFFKDDEKKAIDEAVSLAEKTTAGEIVPALSSAAGRYTQGLYHSAITFAFMATIVLFAVHWILVANKLLDEKDDVWQIPFYVVLPVQLVGLVLGYHVARVSPAIHRAFLPRALLQQRVHHAARRAFVELGVKSTKEGTGILLYVSLFERIALVLADKAIAAKCSQQTWDGVRDLLIAGLKDGKPAQGFTQAIAECGKILSKDFPATGENPNELPNQLRVLA